MSQAVCAALLVLLTGMATAADYRVGPGNYRHSQPQPKLPLSPAGLDGNPLVSGELGVLTSSVTRCWQWSGAQP